MAIDPSIPLSVQTPNIGGAFLQALQLAQQQRLQQQQAAALEEERRAQADLRQQQLINAQRQADIARGTEQAIRQGGGVEDATMTWALANSPASVPSLREFFDKSRKSKLEIDDLNQKLNNARLDHIGHMAEGVLQHGGTPEALQTALALYAEQFPSEAAQVQALGQRLQGASPAQITTFLEQQRAAAPYYQAQQQKAAERGPVSVAAGSTLFDPATQTALYTAPERVTKPPSVQEYEYAVAQGYTGSYTQYQNEDANRKRPVVNVGANAQGGLLDPEGIEYGATEYRLTGRIPAIGQRSGIDRAAIVNAAAKQAKLLGQTPAAAIQRQAAFKADSKSLANIQKLATSAEAFEQKALGQADIVRELSAKVGRTKFPILNAAILAGKTEITGDKDATLLLNAISTFSNEYAKIVEGSTGSAAGSSDSARLAAQKMLSGKMGDGTLNGALDLMSREMALTRQGYDFTIDKITQRMGGQVPDQTQTTAPVTAPAGPPAKPGIIRARDPQGNIHEAPAGTALPPGWTLIGSGG